MPRAVELRAARARFLAGNGSADDLAGDIVAPQVLASWRRCRAANLDPAGTGAPFAGHNAAPGALVTAVEAVLDELDAAGAVPGTLLLHDDRGVIRARRDGDPALAQLLDGLCLAPGYAAGEAAIGTTAAAIVGADPEQDSAQLSGPEHYRTELTAFGTAAARVPGGVLLAAYPDAEAAVLHLTLLNLVAARVAARLAADTHRRAQAVFDAYHQHASSGDWVLATDGDFVLTNAPARKLDGTDLAALTDAATAALVLDEFVDKHLDVASGGCGELALLPVTVGEDTVGCVLVGGPTTARRDLELAEAMRRQGSHVAPLARRDFANDLRPRDRRHADARVRANRELLAPYGRARQDVAAHIKQRRNNVLVGEAGVGKRTLVRDQFRAAHPTGRVIQLDCEMVGADPHLDPAARDERPTLLLLTGLAALSPIGARQLDEVVRALGPQPLLIACIDTPAVDASRPYGLLLRHFHETTRVPPLRFRVEELGEIALLILRRLAGGRSLRLSHQAVRVMEGYAWPGNINELEDVLRYVVSRKPVGEIQPPDLPPVCFQGRTRRLSMLEAAQCDAIISALYESRGNRYKAAAMLGIARSSLYRKIDAFGISYVA